MKQLLLMYKQNNKIRYCIDLIFIFLLPQILIGSLFSVFRYNFTSIFIFKMYLFLRNLCLMSFYIFSFVILFRDVHKLSKGFRKIYNFFLWIYIACSLFLTIFYNGKPYTIISYIAERYENIFIFPVINDTFYLGIKYIITANFFN